MRRRSPCRAAALLVLGAMAFCESSALAQTAVPGPALSQPPASSPAQRKPESSVQAELISNFRLQHGEGRVTSDPTLTRLAREQAAAMATKNILDHGVLGQFSSRMAPAKAGQAAENIAYGYDDFPRTLKMWIESSGHRKNLLLHDASRIGVASARNVAAKRTYWAMVIAGGYEHPAKGGKVIAGSKTTPQAKRQCRVSVLGLCL